MHSIFATIVGFSFTLFAVSTAFIQHWMNSRIVSIVVGVVATVLSVLIFEIPDLAGVWQRLMFAGAFAWLIWYFNKIP